jgi:hypothetical protein
MIINDLNLVGAILGPNETDAPLLVDPDAVLASSVPAKQLQTISRDCLQLCQRGRGIDHCKFSYGCPLEALKARDSLAIEQRLRVL